MQPGGAFQLAGSARVNLHKTFVEYNTRISCVVIHADHTRRSNPVFQVSTFKTFFRMLSGNFEACKYLMR